MSAFFFSVLGLEPTNDVKAIKRAYASALKKIDQELEPDAFGALRQAYERALDWAKSAAGNVAADVSRPDRGIETDIGTDDRGETPRQVEADAGSSAHGKSGTDADSETGSTADIDAPARTTSANQDGGHTSTPVAMPNPTVPQQDTAEIEQALNEWVGKLFDRDQRDHRSLLVAALADDRLLDIRASDWLALCLLRAISQDPHGRLELFNAAAERFGWRAARGPMPRDVEAARWLMLVNDETDRWEQQPDNFQTPYQRAVDFAAQESMPTLKQAGQYWPKLELLQNEFPHRMALQLPAGRLAAWKLAFNESPYVRLGKRDTESRGWGPWAWGIAIVVFIWIFVSLGHSNDSIRKTYQPMDHSRAGAPPTSPYSSLNQGAGSALSSGSSPTPSDLPALRGSNMFSPKYGGMRPGARQFDAPTYESAPPSAWSSHSPIYTNPKPN